MLANAQKTKSKIITDILRLMKKTAIQEIKAAGASEIQFITYSMYLLTESGKINEFHIRPK